MRRVRFDPRVFPSERVVRYTRVEPHVVSVLFERRCGFLWLFREQFEVRFKRSDNGLWFWVDSGIQLELATQGEWEALAEAAGVSP